jgi:hypothetical protein
MYHEIFLLNCQAKESFKFVSVGGIVPENETLYKKWKNIKIGSDLIEFSTSEDFKKYYGSIQKILSSIEYDDKLIIITGEFSEFDTYIQFKKKIAVLLFSERKSEFFISGEEEFPNIVSNNKNENNVILWYDNIDFNMDVNLLTTKLLNSTINFDETKQMYSLKKTKIINFSTSGFMSGILNDTTLLNNLFPKIDESVEYNDVQNDIVIENMKTSTKLLSRSDSAFEELRYTKQGITQIYSDIIQSDEISWVDLNKIFIYFNLSLTIPFIMFKQGDTIKRKVFRKFKDTRLLEKWAKLKEVIDEDKSSFDETVASNIDNGMHGISLKVSINDILPNNYITVKIFKKGGVNVFLRTSIKKQDVDFKIWKLILNFIQVNIIDEINKFNITTRRGYKERLNDIDINTVKFRYIAGIAKLNWSQMKNRFENSKSWTEFLNSQYPYFNIDNGSIRFIKTNKFYSLQNINSILNDEKSKEKISKFFWIAPENIDNFIEKVKSKNEKRKVDEKTKGVGIQARTNAEKQETIFYIEGLSEIYEFDYIISILLVAFWEYYNDINSKKNNNKPIESQNNYIKSINELKQFVKDKTSERNDDGVDDYLSDSDNNDWDNSSDEDDDEEENGEENGEENDEDITEKDSSDSIQSNIKYDKNYKQVKEVNTDVNWLNTISFRLNRLHKYDEELFDFKIENNRSVKQYSNTCQPPPRHPIVLNSIEKKNIDESKYKNSFTDSLFYRGNWYIACENFCWKNNIPLNDTDLIIKNGKRVCPECNGEIITDNIRKSKTTEEDLNKYTVESNKTAKGYFPYIQLKLKHSNPNLTPPCTFKIKAKNTGNLKIPRTAVFSSSIAKTQVKKLVHFPIEFIPKKVYGTLPETLHMLFDNPKSMIEKNMSSGTLLSNVECILRTGIPEGKPLLHSFLVTLCYIYDPTSSYEDVLNKVILKNISKVSVLLRIHHGNVVHLFSKRNININKKDFEEWVIRENITDLDEDMTRAIYKTYINLKDMFLDNETEINHINSWGILCSPGVLFESGLNIYLFHIDIFNGDKYESQYTCPQDDPDEYYVSDSSAKHAFIVYIYNRQTNIIYYEPCVKLQSDSLGQVKRDPISQFQTSTVLNIIIPLRQNCTQIKQTKYIQYMKKEHLIINSIAYSYIHNKQINIIAQFLNPNYKMSFVVIQFSKNKHIFFPIKQRGYINNLPIVTNKNFHKYLNLDVKEACSILLNMNKMDSNYACKPIKYTINIKNNKINGVILNSNRFVPTIESDLDETFIKNLNLEEDYRPNYEFETKTSEDKKINPRELINEYEQFWNKYNVFCYTLSLGMNR